MSNEEMLRSVLRQLQEVQALRDNLRATQARCGELLEETRAQRRRIKELEDELAVVRKVTDFERLKELLKRWQ